MVLLKEPIFEKIFGIFLLTLVKYNLLDPDCLNCRITIPANDLTYILIPNNDLYYLSIPIGNLYYEIL